MEVSLAKPLSPSAQRVCLVAAQHFAQHGYDGSSLTVIAEGAGMRKASLYAHFSNKDSLYEQTLDLAFADQEAAAKAAFASEADGKMPGIEYLEALSSRYAASVNFRFLLRSVYAPPHALEAQIIGKYRSFENELRALFVSAAAKEDEKTRDLTESYLAVVDSLQVELIYNSAENYRARYRAVLRMLQHYYEK
ncbi:hypothetical protein CIK76_14405 [Glutamicibacter sp. BW80]|nr:hypothetical protein CIK76_14405 [Glutamicibacter sp. BW80]